jgi:hypothetical protein
MTLAIGFAHACALNSNGLPPTQALFSHTGHEQPIPSPATASQKVICLNFCVSEQQPLTNSSERERPVGNPLLFVLHFPEPIVATTQTLPFVPHEPDPWRRELPVTLRFPRLLI